MSHRERLDQLLSDSRIWEAGRGSAVSFRSIPSGWPHLDEALGGGWPVGELTELLPDAYGLGEFRLLMPALSALSIGDSGWVMLVAPPHVPFAPAFQAHGFNLPRLLITHASQHMDVFWAMEQALRSRTCAAVVAWSALSNDRALRRLQLAAEEGDCWAVLFRPPGVLELASPAALRMRLSRSHAGHDLTLHILKQRHGRAMAVRVDV
jgi:hypothetical protein